MKRKYTINLDFFNTHSHDLWYIIGFIYADGCLYQNKIEIALAEKDVEFLKSILSRFTDHKLWYNTKTKSYKVSVYSKELTAILKEKFGLTERKSLTIELPEVPREYLWDFIRGYFDGDGNATIHNNRINASIVCGSKIFLESIQEVFKESNIRSWLMQHKNIWQLSISQKNIRTLSSKLYHNSNCLCLERKRDKIIKYENSSYYLSVPQFAKIVGVCAKFISRYQNEFDLPFSFKTEQRYFYSEKDVLPWKEFVDKNWKKKNKVV